MFDLDALGWTVVRMKRPISSTNVPRTRILQRQEGLERTLPPSKRSFRTLSDAQPARHDTLLLYADHRRCSIMYLTSNSAIGGLAFSSAVISLGDSNRTATHEPPDCYLTAMAGLRYRSCPPVFSVHLSSPSSVASLWSIHAPSRNTVYPVASPSAPPSRSAR